MPRGVYERKAKTTEGAPGEGQADTTKPRKRKAKKTNGVRARAIGRPAKHEGQASFVIDDRGSMQIRDGQQQIQLERNDVMRLTVFLERTAAIRK